MFRKNRPVTDTEESHPRMFADTVSVHLYDYGNADERKVAMPA